MHSVSRAFMPRLLTCLTIVAVVGVIKFAAGEHFPVDKISVRGAIEQVDKAQLKQKIADNITGGFFSLQIEALLDAVEQTPWIKEASIKRLGLNRLEVSIQEHEALAYWNDNALLSGEGMVFSPAVFSSDLALPRFSGNALHAPLMAKIYQQLRDTFEPNLKVRTLVVDERASWSMVLDDGISLTIGRADVIDKMQRFYRTHQQHLAKSVRRISSVDMRYANGFAVRWGTKET